MIHRYSCDSLQMLIFLVLRVNETPHRDNVFVFISCSGVVAARRHEQLIELTCDSQPLRS